MKHPQHSRSLFSGVFAGALTPAFLIAFLLSFSSERAIVPVLAGALIVFLVSFVVLTIAGLPLVLLLRSRGWLSAISICAAGLIVGAILMAAFNFYSNYWPQMNDRSFAISVACSSAMKGVLPGALFGSIVSVAFCLGAGISIRSHWRGISVKRPTRSGWLGN